jgi:uncharacterized protein YbjT (DUF2867 family)
MQTLLITTPTGNVGLETLRALATLTARPTLRIVGAVRNPDKDRPLLTTLTDDLVPFDFTQPGTFEDALRRVDKVLLVRPPQLADAGTFLPFIDAMQRAGVRQVVFLSLQGVENNPLTPHHKIEKLIRKAGLGYTMLRPSFFMQNLSTTHRREIAEHSEIYIPAGNGRTSLIDAVDIGEIAAMALATDNHLNQAYELTGTEALTYTEMAATLSTVLERPIRYKAPSVVAFIWRRWVREKTPLPFVLVMVALYTVARLGKAAGLTTVFHQLTGHAPRTFRQFAEANRAAWA